MEDFAPHSLFLNQHGSRQAQNKQTITSVTSKQNPDTKQREQGTVNHVLWRRRCRAVSEWGARQRKFPARAREALHSSGGRLAPPPPPRWHSVVTASLLLNRFRHNHNSAFFFFFFFHPRHYFRLQIGYQTYANARRYSNAHLTQIGRERCANGTALWKQPVVTPLQLAPIPILQKKKKERIHPILQKAFAQMCLKVELLLAPFGPEGDMQTSEHTTWGEEEICLWIQSTRIKLEPLCKVPY